MKRALAVAAVVVAMGCRNSSGPGQSPWVGTWSVQPTTPPGLAFGPLAPPGTPFTAVITDSAGLLRVQLPTLELDDITNVDNTIYAAGQHVVPGTRDSLSFTLSAVSGINGFTYAITLAGTATGSSGAGTLTVAVLGSSSAAGTWTATKQ